MKTTEVPTGEDACFVVQSRLGLEPVQVHRFKAGLCHFVFRVEMAGGRKVVVRLSGPEARCFSAGGVYWNKLLRPMGVPLPEILLADLTPSDSIFPFVVLEFLEGTDLCAVYPTLSSNEKFELAIELVRIQESVSRLPHSSRFGYAFSYDSPPIHRTWEEVILVILHGAEERMNKRQHPGRLYADRTRQLLCSYTSYFSAVRPTPFLDDITTKNVLVHHGRLSGIVDVDQICFGDSLLTIGLTRMALMADSFDLDYIEHWMDLLKLDSQQRRIVNAYTLLFCVVFMSDDYLLKTKLSEEPEAPLFPAARAGLLSRRPIKRVDAAEMIKRRLRQAGLPEHYSAHPFRAAGVTNFLENGGSLEVAQRIAGHADSRTTKLYDRRSEKLLVEDMERIRY
jgi:Ser/Thr protein kinase RdoA (MazF antagonist)